MKKFGYPVGHWNEDWTYRRSRGDNDSADQTAKNIEEKMQTLNAFYSLASIACRKYSPLYKIASLLEIWTVFRVFVFRV